MLAFKYHRRRFDNLVLFRYGRGLHYRTTEVAAQHFGAAMRRERFVDRGNHLRIKGRARPFTPVQLAVVQPRLLGVALKAKARHGIHVFMQQSAFQQLAHQQRYTACGLEVVNIRRTVRVQPCHQRHHGRDLGEVIPVNQNARRTRHGHQVHGVVG